MDVKEAARTAKEYLADLFSEEEITDVGLEEVAFDGLSSEWRITMGFSRPWNRQRGHMNVFAALGDRQPSQMERSYKVIAINDESGAVISLKDRFLAAANK